MLDLETAVAEVLAALPTPQAERISLVQAAGRILAGPVVSPIDLPCFDNSAMDGYAVRAAEVMGAKPDAPVRLRLQGRIAAGEIFSGALAPGECIRLFTGAPIPPGADAVVMQEDTRVETGGVLICDTVRPGENVRLRGEDLRSGASLGTPGQEVSPGLIGLLGAVGVGEIMVGRRPVTGVLATGSELREAGRPLTSGQIYESNRAMLVPLIARAGGTPKIYPLIRDTLDATRAALEEALQECDIIVTSGGVSVGEMDFVKAAFESLGGELQFWRVAIRPGKPFVFGRMGNKFLFGLPGNPVSAFVTFLLLARPALLRWQGAEEVFLPQQRGVLAEAFGNAGERRHFMRVRMDAAGKVYSAGKQASHVMSSLAGANGLLDLPAGANLPAGTEVSVRRID